jgi:hypothetical protein
MKRLASRARLGVPLAMLTIAATSFSGPLAAASGSGVPFHDTNVRGSLTFCNRAGQPVTSGSLNAVPFVWKAISSALAPAGYRTTAARATLDAYQPIQFVDPGDWSGGQLTGSSAFSNGAHPVAQATNADSPLLNFVQAYPPHWQGLIEIRMLFSGVNKVQLQSPYPAAVIRINGNTWTLVSGGGGSCSAGRGISDESFLLPKNKLKRPETVVPAGESSAQASAAAAKASSPSPSSKSSTSAAHSEAPPTQSGPAALAAASSSTGMSAAAKTGIGLGVLALIGVGVMGAIWWRRRPVDGP